MYVDKTSADMVARALRNEVCDEVMSDEVDGEFKARFMVQGDEHIKFPIRKDLAVAARGGVEILVIVS